MLSKEETRRKIEAFEAGTSSDLTGVPDVTAEKLKARRDALEASRSSYEADQAAKGEERSETLRLGFIASGGTNAQWAKEGGAIVAADRAERARTAAAAPKSLIPSDQFLN